MPFARKRLSDDGTELNDFANSGVLTSVTDHSKAVSRLPRPESVAQ